MKNLNVAETVARAAFWKRSFGCTKSRKIGKTIIAKTILPAPKNVNIKTFIKQMYVYQIQFLMGGKSSAL